MSPCNLTHLPTHRCPAQIGSFGAITPFTSLLQNRLTMWDVSAAGPLAGGSLALGVLLYGLVQSMGVDPTDAAAAATLVKVPTPLFQVCGWVWGGKVCGYGSGHQLTGERLGRWSRCSRRCFRCVNRCGIDCSRCVNGCGVGNGRACCCWDLQPRPCATAGKALRHGSREPSSWYHCL